MSSYLGIALASPIVQAQMVGVGSGLQHIHLRDLREDRIPLPPLAEQSKIVHRVEAFFAYADRLEAYYKAALAYADNLTPALLAKAFRGELVPQDPNDEPASVLLERIKAARNGEGKSRSRAVAKPVATTIKADAAENGARQMTLDDALAGMGEIFGGPPQRRRDGD